MVTGVSSSNMVQPANASNNNNSLNQNDNISGAVQNVQTSPTTVVKKISDNRRSNKPIMEKRRRARINNCLNELKTLILDAMKKDPARHSKLEKADILEMTVKHLQNLQRQQLAMSAATDPTILNKFRAGFSECASEVGRFPGLDPTVRRRLLQHLANCLNNKSGGVSSNPAQQEVVQVHILPNGSVMEQNNMAANNGNSGSSGNSGIILSNGNGVQLLPTRLPNGDIALVLPSSGNNQNSGQATLPLLVPIPQRTSSTASCSSSSSNYSLSNSPEPMETQCYQPKPLSLVMRKIEPMQNIEEEKPWRPW